MPRNARGIALMAILVAAPAAAQTRHVTQGPAERILDNLYVCPREVPNSRLSAVGRIAAADGGQLTIPAETAFSP